jgi:D-amino peptidase
VLSHTFVHKEIIAMRINGVEVGEVEIAAGVAGHFGVSIGFISGDDVTYKAANNFFGDIESAVVKRAIDRYAADCLPLEAARDLIRKKSQRAVERAEEFKPFHFKPPYTMEWVCTDHNIAMMLARVLGAELVPQNMVRYVNGTDFIEIFNMLIVWRSLLRTATVPN